MENNLSFNMELLNKNYVDTEFEELFSEYIKDWSVEEIEELFAETLAVLEASKAKLNELKEQGVLKRFVGFFNGKNRKLKYHIQYNYLDIQKMTLNMIRILIRRLGITLEQIQNLNEKVNKNYLEHEKTIVYILEQYKDITEQVENLEQRLELSEFCSFVAECKTLKNERYADLPDTQKILYIVAGIFERTKDKHSIKEEMLATALKNIGLPNSIKMSKFFEDIIRNPEWLSLYIKEELVMENSSLYGNIINEVYQFYLKKPIELYQIVNVEKKLPCEICMEKIKSKNEELFQKNIESMELCKELLKGMWEAKKMAEEYKKPYWIDDDWDEVEERSGENIEPEVGNKAIIYITPEEVSINYNNIWIKQEKESFLTKELEIIEEKVKDYSKRLEKEIGNSQKEIELLMIVPGDMSGNHIYKMREIVSETIKNIEIISQQDFCMYQWYREHVAEVKEGKTLIFLEEWNKKVVATQYHILAKGYRKINTYYFKNVPNIGDMIKQLRWQHFNEPVSLKENMFIVEEGEKLKNIKKNWNKDFGDYETDKVYRTIKKYTNFELMFQELKSYSRC